MIELQVFYSFFSSIFYAFSFLIRHCCSNVCILVIFAGGFLPSEASDTAENPKEVMEVLAPVSETQSTEEEVGALISVIEAVSTEKEKESPVYVPEVVSIEKVVEPAPIPILEAQVTGH